MATPHHRNIQFGDINSSASPSNSVCSHGRVPSDSTTSTVSQFGIERGEIWDPRSKYDMHPATLFPIQAHYDHFASFLPYQDPFLGTLREQVFTTWRLMFFNTTNTFFARIRCPRCKQLPLTEFSASKEGNHAMPAGVREVWRLLMTDSALVDPCYVNALSLWEVARRFEEMELLYFEDNTAGVECGLVGWNGSRAPEPVQ